VHLECNMNVPGVSRILLDYFPIGYKMLPNLTPRLYFLCPFFLGGMSTRQILSADWERILRTFKKLRKKRLNWKRFNDTTTIQYVPTAFEPRSSGYRQFLKCIPAEFFSYGIRFRQHSRCIRGTFRLIWDALRTFGQDSKWLAFSILPRMRSECVECCWNAVRIFRK